MPGSSHTLDRLDVRFDDEHLVSNGGLLLTATLAQHLGLKELFDSAIDLGSAPGRANVGHQAMTVIHSLLAGGDCIDDANALRAGSTEQVLGHELRAPSTLGTFLRSFTFGHARQLDRVSRDLLARAWAAGAGPGDDAFTIDLDSTICETYGFVGVHGNPQVSGRAFKLSRSAAFTLSRTSDGAGDPPLGLLVEVALRSSTETSGGGDDKESVPR